MSKSFLIIDITNINQLIISSLAKKRQLNSKPDMAIQEATELDEKRHI